MIDKSFCHLLLLGACPLDLKDRNPVVLAFPALPVQAKALCFGLRNARKHAHLHNHLTRVSGRF
jgi:hypothetical protein